MRPNRLQTAWRIAATVALAASLPVSAERLPLRRYSSADGLAGDFVTDIYRDRRGFLWFSTRDGLSRFDGVEFHSYGVGDGLPIAAVNAVLETRDGNYWVATNGGGVARFQPTAEPRFVVYPVGHGAAHNRVNVLREDQRGRLWVGTDEGLFVRAPDATAGEFQRVGLALPDDLNLHGVAEVLESADHSIWVCGGFGLRRFLSDGRLVRYQMTPAGPRDTATSLLITEDQTVWVGFRRGLLRVRPQPAQDATDAASLERVIPTRDATSPTPEDARWYATPDGLPSEVVTALHQSPDGQLWVGTTAGLAQWTDDHFRAYRGTNGLPDAQVSDLDEDAAGNLWIATVAGTARLVRHGLVTYTDADGLGDASIHAIAEDATGALVVVNGDFRVSRFDGHRFESARAAVSPDATCNWMSPCGHLDSAGGWWMLTTAGLDYWSAPQRLTDLEHTPNARFGTGEGLLDGNTFVAFSDSRHRLWIGAASGGVARFDPARRAWRVFTERDGLPPRSPAGRANAFAEDPRGHVWIGFEGAGLARERDEGFERVGPMVAAPPSVTALFVDATGRLWFGTNRSGLGLIDDPLASPVQIRFLTTADGLASNNIRTVVDDGRGRVFAGTSRGVDRITMKTGEVTHYTVAEGLASQFVTASFRDRRGALWFGTVSGLSRLDPGAEMTRDTGRPAPPVYVSRVRAGGVPLPVSELGDAAPPAFEVPASNRRLEIEFFALNDAGTAPLRYQYRLDGGDSEWSPPTEQRSVNFARLAPGAYRVLVRTMRADGAAGASPAVVAFRVLPPFYATWWFVLLTGTLVTGIAIVGYRVRVTQLLRVERVRARIATDLHDDIGASLSQIAILSEVARRRLTAPASEPGASESLERIADVSRGLVDSMSDIVWAINPEADTLSDLVHRMRRFVEDTLGASDVAVTFIAPTTVHDLTLGADVRREVFLILKESVTNIAKHAAARTVAIELGIRGRHLHLDVRDDGRGFDPDARVDGNGVASMRRRVATLGGRLTFDSAPGRGSRIRLDLDLGRAGGLLQP
jgi:ligand-binding sensor domain-containing protein/two-component sensor histidine kinase